MTQRAKPGIRRWLKGLMLRYMHRMITCREFEEFVARYLDDALSPREKSVFEWHLAICRECRDYLAAYRRSIELGRGVLGAAEEPVPADVPEDLIKAILDARSS